MGVVVEEWIIIHAIITFPFRVRQRHVHIVRCVHMHFSQKIIRSKVEILRRICTNSCVCVFAQKEVDFQNVFLPFIIIIIVSLLNMKGCVCVLLVCVCSYIGSM
jgi:hypothetical protein